MKKIVISIIITMLTTFGLSFAQGTHSGQSVSNALAASAHASKSAVHSVAASGQVVSGVMAVPLMSAGVVGASSAEAGDALWDAATAPAEGPLEISDETVTVGPRPDKAVQQQDR